MHEHGGPVLGEHRVRERRQDVAIRAAGPRLAGHAQRGWHERHPEHHLAHVGRVEMRDVVHEVVREHGSRRDDEPSLLVQRGFGFVVGVVRVQRIRRRLRQREIRRGRSGGHRRIPSRSGFGGVRDSETDCPRGDARGAQLEQRRVHRAPQADVPEQIQPVRVEPGASRKRSRLSPEHRVK